MPKKIVWFRQDLRTKDNPALFEAAQDGEVVPVYILDVDPRNKWSQGGASKWWLHHSLKDLQASGVPLILRKGKPLEVLRELLQETGADSIYWNRCYEPYTIERDKEIKAQLGNIESFNGSLMFEPWTVKTKANSFYKVFTPFWRACLEGTRPRQILETPDIEYSKKRHNSLQLEDFNLLPRSPDWSSGFTDYWHPGEMGAHAALKDFLEDKLFQYAEGRDYPARDATSRLSPHLHFGEISPNQIWDAVHKGCDPNDKNTQRFLAELGWREFSYNLLYHHPALPSEPFQKKFTALPWDENKSLLNSWQKGQTGYPLVDAGMRELWATGYMHNRLRMITASFLTKHCLIPWQQGEAWFWDTLVDADLANNAASWQWVAGCGADAAPFFRIFNPVTQSQKFDPSGEYIRTWVSEVREFSDKDIHAPWRASQEIQTKAGCVIGRDYPSPIVDLDVGRAKALDAYNVLKL